MKILSMTATFGKLEHQTLTLQPGMNVIHAPNEWGKSTWCAFLVAMLYGIETKERTTLTSLAVKERYAPWSGSAMSGRMDILWNGRAITIERSTKGRSVFGVFRAYETDTGLDVAELTGENCGQVLLGVEKSVFLRAGFLRSSDMPVTQDEALRKRLNALVTTADESGTADALADALRDLRNKIRSNRSNGLLPVAQAQKEELENKLRQLKQLQEQSANMKQQLLQVEQEQAQLRNHSAALRYQAQQTQAEKLRDARAALLSATAKAEETEERCKMLPDAQTVQATRQQLQQLRDDRTALHERLQLLPSEPKAPEVAEVFRGIPPQQAMEQAKTDSLAYQADSRNKAYALIGLVLVIFGIAGLLIPQPIVRGIGLVLTLIGLVLSFILYSNRVREANARRALEYRYSPIPPENWEQAAQEYAQAQDAYASALAQYQQQRQSLQQQLETLNRQMEALTGGIPLAECERKWEEALQLRQAAQEARKEQRRLEELVQAMAAAGVEAEAPQMPDVLTLTEQQTEKALTDCIYAQRQLQLQLGNCQGRMETLGQESGLQQALDKVNTRIAKLEQTYEALTLAQDTLVSAVTELQRRFAPRIANRAQELLSRLTGGRYDRLRLDGEMAVHTGAKEEDTLHTAIWRSEGTMDQLYLALRLAVAEELTPDAPLVLDDALVRFDDTRGAAAMEILQAAANQKQVILFTCQQRETQWMS